MSDCDAAQPPPNKQDLPTPWADFDDPDLTNLRDGAASAARYIGDGFTTKAGITLLAEIRAPQRPRPCLRARGRAGRDRGRAGGGRKRPPGGHRAGLARAANDRDQPADENVCAGAVRPARPRPEGIVLLAGKPRLGKSSLALDLALAVACGGCALGGVQAAEGDVLYLALDDSRRRLQRRVARLLPPGAPWPQRLTLATRWQRLEHDGLTDIAQWCGSAAAPRLIVIDPLSKALAPAKPGRPAPMDGRHMAALHRLAAARGIAVVAVHHARSKDVDRVLDGLGLHDAADTILVLACTSTGATLHARGRDIADSETALQRDTPSGGWTLLGPAADVRRSLERRQILDILAAAGAPVAVKDIMRAAGIGRRSAADIMLCKMAAAGEVARTGRGRYALPNLPAGRKIVAIDCQAPEET